VQTIKKLYLAGETFDSYYSVDKIKTTLLNSDSRIAGYPRTKKIIDELFNDFMEYIYAKSGV
jgi:hypothetical protein